MKEFILILLLLITQILASEAIFPGRSGDVVIVPNSIEDNSVVYSLHRTRSPATHIDENSVADLISHNLGLGVISSSASRSALPDEGVFDKSRANVLVYVDGVDLSKAEQWKVLSGSQRLGLNKQFYPQDAVSQATTLMTGESPAKHGIVLKQWKHGPATVRAFEEALPETGSVVDTLSQAFNGRALTFSGSADFQIAAALGAHRIFLEDHPEWNNYVFSYNHTAKQLESASSHGSDIFGMSQVGSQVAALVGSPFDKTRPEDAAFLTELQMIFTLSDNLPAAKELQDQVPDMINLGISSLRTLAGRYCAEDDLVVLAYSMMGDALNKLATKLSAVYGEKFSFQLVLQPPTAYEKLAKNHGLHERVDHVPGNRLDSELFPVLYGKFSDNVCVSLQPLAASVGYASCHQNAEPTFVVNGVQYSSSHEEAGQFHLYLWTGVALILAVYASVYATYTMDIGIDSALYRATTMKDPVKLE